MLLVVPASAPAQENRYDLFGRLLMPFVSLFAKSTSSPNRARTIDTLEAGGWLSDVSGIPKSGVLKGRCWQMTPGLSSRFEAELTAHLASLALVQARIQGAR